MLTIIILFLTALVTLFVAFAKKPILTLSVSIIGLVATGASLICQMNHPSNFLSSYEGIRMDEFAIRFSLVAVIFTGLLILTGFDSFKARLEHVGDYIGLLLFSLFGAVVMVSFTDMFMFFLGLEILSIPIYVMAGVKKDDSLSSEASLKYFMTGAFATGILLFGIAWLYGATGSFKIDEIQLFFEEAESISSLAYVGVLLILASFLFKIGAAPFHFWSPDVYDGAPSTVTGFMAAVVKLGAFGAFIKLFSIAFGHLYDFWMPVLAILAILTMFVGNLSALRQVRFKRLLAYSSIAHVGYSLITMIVLTSNSASNLWFYLVAYGFSTIALITVQLIVNDREDRIEAFKGLGRSNPFVAFVAVLALLGLAGVPPLMGFFGKYLIFVDAITTNPALIIVALLNSGIGIYYYLRTVVIILQKPEGDVEIETPSFKATPLQLLVLLVCAIGIIFGGGLLL